MSKRTIEIMPIELSVSIRQITTPLEVREQLSSALAEARMAISEDPELWRHIGKPAEGIRALSGLRLLATEHTYQEALHAAAQGELALPAWRAYMTVSGQETLGRTPSDRGRIVRMNVALINTTPRLPRAEKKRAQLEECALFDCGFALQVNDCDMVPFEFRGTPEDYRQDRNFAALGSSCVTVQTEDGTGLYTETVPLYEQPWYRTRNDLPVRFGDLDDAPDSDPLATLDAIAGRMDDYVADWDQYLADEAPYALTSHHIAQCQRDRDAFAAEVANFRWGVVALRADPDLLRSFRLMNRVFRENGEQRTPLIESWRLFQLAFMVTQLPTLAAREYDIQGTDAYAQALAAALDRVDVLWFPTGGGKTEAYLGLIATALFYDRLRGKTRGVSAWMRFPLRMLSLQQLERLARVVARAEMVRADADDLRRGDSDPFAIGYYVGGGNTPNRITESDLPTGAGRETAWEKVQVVRHCPFCDGDVQIAFKKASWRLAHVCQNPACYSNTAESLGVFRGSLPIVVVDNEIYRYRPSVLVGTVDKLAVLGFQKYFAHVVAPVTQRCRLHGYASFGQCLEAGGGPCKATKKDFDQLPPDKDPIPAFLIQDELHLLKEELGTFDAHYEGFLQHIAKKQGYKPAKILAATATIEAYEQQAFHLYLKSANRFPQPSWRAGESFYATSTPRIERRLYGGVMTHHRSPETAVIRALEVYTGEIQQMRADPAGALQQYDLSLVYVNRKATGGNIGYGLHQSSAVPFPLTTTLLTGDNTMTEVGAVIERIERERQEVEEPRLDVLIATSLISHGVDLERINFLCLAGMPSKYAEYIQASSRAARNNPGIVLVCFKRSDLRERSQYHYFLPNHRYLDRLVEAVPINRFSSFAAKRTVPGLLAGMLLSYYSRILFNQKHTTKAFDNLKELQTTIKAQTVTQEQLEQDMQEIIGAHHPKLDALQQQYVSQSIAAALAENWELIMRSLEQRLTQAIHPMTSFRDVDDTLDFVAEGAASVFVDRISATS